MALIREAERCLTNINTRNALLNAFSEVRSSQSIIRDVSMAQKRKDEGNSLSKMDGKIIAVKDNICTYGLTTTCASNMLQGFLSPNEAPAVTALRNNGAILVGKTNMDEFGMGCNGAVRTHNMHENDGEQCLRSAGGSSGGSATAVATEMCYAALGSDTGGSIRLPASYCGIIGFKPSYGMVSRSGLIAYANSLDTIGVLGRNVEVVRHVYGIINTFDPRDPTCLPPEARRKVHQTSKELSIRRGGRPLKIGVPIEFNINDLSIEVREAWKTTLHKLADLGHSIQAVQLSRVKEALSAYYVIAPAEASSNLAKYDGIRYGSRPGHIAEETQNSSAKLYELIRKHGFGKEVQRRITLGTYTLSAEAINNYFVKAQKVRRLVKEDFDSVFEFPNVLENSPPGCDKSDGKVDFLLTPTAVTTAPLLEDIEFGVSALDAYVNDVLTVPASMAGIPAMSIPVKIAGGNSGLPVGVQIMAQYGDEDGMFELAGIIEALE